WTGCNTGLPPPPKPLPVFLQAQSRRGRARRSDSPGAEWRGRERRSSRREEFRPSPRRKSEQPAPCRWRDQCPCGDGPLARPEQNSASALLRRAPARKPKIHTAFPLAVIVQVLLECAAQPIRPRIPSRETRRSKDPAPQNQRDPQPLLPPLESCSPPRSATNPRPYPA